MLAPVLEVRPVESLDAILNDRLLRAQNPDGGWGATPGRTSNTEATSLALLALRERESPGTDRALKRGGSWLTTHQCPDGGWPISPALPQS